MIVLNRLPQLVGLMLELSMTVTFILTTPTMRIIFLRFFCTKVRAYTLEGSEISFLIGIYRGFNKMFTLVNITGLMQEMY